MSESKVLVRRVLLCAAVLALVMAGCGGLFWSADFALSVVLGAALVCGSFFLLQRDVHQLMDLAATSKEAGALGKIGFLLKSLGRFAVLAVVLFVAAGKMTIQPLGLILGLTTIMISVIVVGLAQKRKRISGISE